MTIHIIGGGGRHDNYFRCAFYNMLSGLGDVDIEGATYGGYNSDLAARLDGFAAGPGAVSFTPGDDYYLVTCFDPVDILNDRSASSIMSDIEDYCALAKAKGYTYVLTTFCPGPTGFFSAGQLVVLDAVNDLIRAYTGADFILDFDATPGLDDGDDALIYATDLGNDFSHLGCMRYAEAITRTIGLPSRVVGGSSYSDTQYSLGYTQYWVGGFLAASSQTATHIWCYAANPANVYLTVRDGTGSAMGSNLLGVVGPVAVVAGLNYFELDTPIDITEGDYVWLGGISDGGVGGTDSTICRYEGGYTNTFVAFVSYASFDPDGTFSLNSSDVNQMSIGLANLPDTGIEYGVTNIDLPAVEVGNTGGDRLLQQEALNLSLKAPTVANVGGTKIIEYGVTNINIPAVQAYGGISKLNSGSLSMQLNHGFMP